ncbi:hypothetical protein KC345_g11087, partial [Hortaea werneckii]
SALPKIRGELLREILEHDYDPYRETRIFHRLRTLQADWIASGPSLVLLFEADDLKSVENREGLRREKELILFGIGNVVKQTLEEDYPEPFILYQDSKQRWVAVLRCAMEKGTERIEELGNLCIERIHAFVKVKASAALCTVPGAISELHARYAEAEEILEQKAIYGGQRLLTSRGWEQESELENPPITNPDEVLDLIRYGTEADIQAAMSQFYELVQSWSLCQIKDIQQHIFEWLLGIFKKAAQLGWSEQGWQRNPMILWDRLERYDTLESLRGQAELCLLEMARDFAELASSPGQIIQEAEKYILQHYADNLTLQSVASEVHVTPVWLSKLFKKEKHQTFLEYLTEVRMENAKKMLAEVKYKIYQISSLVGYKDPVHFTKLFKKQTGCTPKEFRKLQGIADDFLIQARKSFEVYLSQLNSQMNDLIGNKQLQDLLKTAPAGWEEEELFTVNMLTLLNNQALAIDAFRVHIYPIDPAAYTDYMNTIGEPGLEGREEWFQKARSSISPAWHLSMPSSGRYAKPLLTYTKRFTGLYDRQPRGIIAADVSEDQLARYISPSGNIAGQKLLLLDDDGSVLYDSSANEWTGQPEMAGRFHNLTNGPEISRTIGIGGQKYLASSLKLDSRPWYLVSLSPLSELTGTIDEINRVMLIFLVLYLLCSIGVVIYFTVHFTQPVVRLVQLMRKAEKGHFRHHSVWSKRNDEVGWLYRGYTSLTTQIETLIEEASRSEWKKKELEFQVLSHQINPHFLYNTLESIRWKAETHGRSDISEMVAALGNLLRLSLNQGKEITTLRREIEQLQAYVQIEQARMGQTIRILYAIEPELQPLPFMRL